MAEEPISIPTPDGQADGYLYRPDGHGPWPGVVLFMDGIGLRAAMREMAARLAENGYVVLLPNLYYRDGAVRDMTLEKDGARIPTLAANVMKDGGGMRDADAYLSYLAAHPSVTPGKLGCTGYCMGGYHSLMAAGLFPERIGAAASFHGAHLASDAPDSPHRRAHAMVGPSIYVGVAAIDPYLAPGETDRLRGALEGAAVAHRMEVYEGAAHGFAVLHHAPYNEAASERHWAALVGLLKGAL